MSQIVGQMDLPTIYVAVLWATLILANGNNRKGNETYLYENHVCLRESLSGGKTTCFPFWPERRLQGEERPAKCVRKM